MKSQRLAMLGIGLSLVLALLLIGGQTTPRQALSRQSPREQASNRQPAPQANGQSASQANEQSSAQSTDQVAQATEEKSDEVADPDPARWAKAVNEFERWDGKNAWPDKPVLFVGSSSIEFWKTRAAFPRLPVVNRGLGGAHISVVNHYFDRIVKPYRPRVIVLYAGDNDVAQGKGARRVFEDYREFIKQVRALDADTPVIYIAIKPSTARWRLWPTMNEANELIRTMSEGDEKLYFVDTATPSLGADGAPRKELLADDGLHLNEAGYKLWTDFVGTTIEKAMQRTNEK